MYKPGDWQLAHLIESMASLPTLETLYFVSEFKAKDGNVSVGVLVEKRLRLVWKLTLSATSASSVSTYHYFEDTATLYAVRVFVRTRAHGTSPCVIEESALHLDIAVLELLYFLRAPDKRLNRLWIFMIIGGRVTVLGPLDQHLLTVNTK